MFDEYRRRLCNYVGVTEEDTLKSNSTTMLDLAFNASTSYKRVIVNGEYYDARIISDSKTTTRGGTGNYVIQFKSGIRFNAGTYIDIYNDGKEMYEKWMIIYDTDNPLFSKPLIKKCNHLLKWKNYYGEIVERWVIFSDNIRLSAAGTQWAAQQKATLPVGTFTLILPCDYETINIRRDKRFLIDEYGTIEAPDAYIVTNRNVFTKTTISKCESECSYDGNVELALTQQQFNPETDNAELMIADYYGEYNERPYEPPETATKTAEILYQDSSDLKMGASYKAYTCHCYENGEEVSGVNINWEVRLLDEYKDLFDYKVENNILYIKCVYSPLLINTEIRLVAADDNKEYTAEKLVKVVSII